MYEALAECINIAFGTHEILDLWQGGETFDITPFGRPVRLGADPPTTAKRTAIVTVEHTGHGLTIGDPILVADAVAVGGITPNGGPFTVTVVDADLSLFAFTSNATSTSAAAGPMWW